MLLQTPYRRVCISQHLPVPLPAAQSDVSPNLHGTHRPRTLLADDSRVARTHNPAVEQAGMTRGARGGTTGIALARARASPGPWPRARPSFWPASTAAAAAAAKTAAARRLHEHTIERPEGLGLSAVARPRHACARLRTRQSDSGTTLVGRRRSVLAGRRSVDRRPRHLLRRRPAPAPPVRHRYLGGRPSCSVAGRRPRSSAPREHRRTTNCSSAVRRRAGGSAGSSRGRVELSARASRKRAPRTATPAVECRELGSTRAPRKSDRLPSSGTPSWRFGRELARAHSKVRARRRGTGQRANSAHIGCA
mmetsp:Transcript_18397/g.59997  ORF Transcript_18397/g.59997 Transcript_18397/m.59997 type:complete len:307 (+) Transcript_18397:535-1455(+)